MHPLYRKRHKFCVLAAPIYGYRREFLLLTKTLQSVCRSSLKTIKEQHLLLLTKRTTPLSICSQRHKNRLSSEKFIKKASNATLMRKEAIPTSPKKFSCYFCYFPQIPGKLFYAPGALDIEHFICYFHLYD